MSALPAGPTRSWRPGFYPAEVKPPDFLRHYSERLPSVELNTTGYRLPAEDQFRRWAEQVSEGFRFSVKFARHRLGAAGPSRSVSVCSATGSDRFASSSAPRATRACSL